MLRISRFSTSAISSAAAAAAPAPVASRVSAAAVAAARRRPAAASTSHATPAAPRTAASASTSTAPTQSTPRRAPIRSPRAVPAASAARKPTASAASAASPAPPPPPAQADLDDFPLPTDGIEDYTRLSRGAPPRPARAVKSQPTPSPPLTALPGSSYTPLPDAASVAPTLEASASALPPASAACPSHPGELGAKTMGDGYAFLSRVPGELPVEDWTTSFRGLSEAPFDKDVAEALLRPLEIQDVEIKPDGLLYLPEIKYRRTLNAAFGPGGWGMAPRGETHVGPRIVSREWGLVCLGRLVAIARGEQEYFDPSGIPTATEACKSNALMRCCKDLGIASELWDPRFIREFKSKYCTEAMVEHVTQKKRRKLWRKKDAKFEYPYKEIGPVPK